MAGLADRLEAATTDTAHVTPHGLGELAGQVARLAEMLEASGKLRPATPNIDQAMGELVRRVEQVRTSAIEAAEHAAKEVIASIGQGQLSSADAMSINNLKHELNAIRTSSETANSRTEETLEVMRDVLTTIVDPGSARMEHIELAHDRDGDDDDTDDARDEIYSMSQTAADALLDDPADDLLAPYEDDATPVSQTPEHPFARSQDPAETLPFEQETTPQARMIEHEPEEQPAAEEDDVPLPVGDSATLAAGPGRSRSERAGTGRNGQAPGTGHRARLRPGQRGRPPGLHRRGAARGPESRGRRRRQRHDIGEPSQAARAQADRDDLGRR